MNYLITRSIEERDASFLVQMPKELMNDYEKKVLEFILSHSRKHKETPSMKRLMKKFEEFLPFKKITTKLDPHEDPLSLIFQETVQKKLLQKCDDIISEVKEGMKTEGEVDLEKVGEILKLHAISTGVHAYSSFDRSTYFGRESIEIPFKLINMKMGGLALGDVLLIVGRLGTGKSTIAQFIAQKAWEQGKKILFISAEMKALDVFARVDGMVGRFNPLLLRDPDPSKTEAQLVKVMKKIDKTKGEIIVPRRKLLTPAEIAELAKNLDVDQIVIDGAYLLQPSTGRYSAKHERISAVSNEIKQMALDLNLPIISTAQIKRGASEGSTYDNEAIAGSDALGQDADAIIAVKADPLIEGRSELQLIKNRHGGRIVTQVFVDFETMTVVDESVTGESPKASASSKIKEISLAEWAEE